MEFAFDRASHTYRINGAIVPSVTQVIGAVMPGWQAAEWYLQRGLALHHGCHLADKGVLDWHSVSPEIHGRIRAWLRFRDEYRAECVMAEMPMSHPIYRYAGAPDRGFESDERLTVCDLKSTIEPQVRLQLGGYSLLWTANNGGRKVWQAVAVELHDDETYRTLWLDQHELRRAEQAFLNCLGVYGFMTAHNLMKGQR